MNGTNQQNQVVQKNVGVTPYGGGPPPGYGAVQEEDFLWETPSFSLHPLTKKMEAISGIFFRLWPEHVKILQDMRRVNWAHVEIARVASELWKKQQEAYKKDKEITDTHSEMAHEKKKSEVQQIHEPLPGEHPKTFADMLEQQEGDVDEGDDTMKSQQDSLYFWKSLSTLSGRDYRNKLEEFRGRFYSKDAPSAVVGTNIFRGVHQVPSKSTEVSPFSSYGLPALKKNQNGFRIEVLKSSEGGEPVPTAEELRRKRDMTFTRKETGVSNAPFSSEVPKKKEELV